MFNTNKKKFKKIEQKYWNYVQIMYNKIVQSGWTKGKDGVGMVYNYDKLKGRITEKCATQKKFAELMGLSERTISLKLNNEIAFDQDEITKAVQILGLKDKDVQPYFFNLDVQSDWTKFDKFRGF